MYGGAIDNITGDMHGTSEKVSNMSSFFTIFGHFMWTFAQRYLGENTVPHTANSHNRQIVSYVRMFHI